MRPAADTARFIFWAQGGIYALLGLIALFYSRPAGPDRMLGAAYLAGAAACWAGAYAWPRNVEWRRPAVAVASLAALPAFPFGTGAGCVGLYWSVLPKARAAGVLEEPPPVVAPEHAEAAPYRPQPGDGTVRWIQVAFPVIWFLTWAAGLYFVNHWGRSLGLPRIAALNGMLVILAGMLITVTLHEVGHALAGWAMAMKVKLFQAGPLRFECSGGRWSFQFQWAGLIGLGGGVASVPQHMRNLRARMIVEIAAGPAASLLAGLAAWQIMPALPGSAWEPCWKIVATVMATSLHAAVLNLVPLGEADGFSDGAALAQLIRGGQFAEYRAAMKLVGSTTVTDTRPRDLDPVLLAGGLRAGEHTSQAGLAQMIQLVCAVDREDYGRARELLERGLERIPSPDRAPDAECAAEIALYLAFLDGHAGRAAAWLTASEALAERTGYPIADSFDYWFSVAAVRKAEGRTEESHAAFERASCLLARKPKAGLYDYERDLVVRVRDGAGWLRPVS